MIIIQEDWFDDWMGQWSRISEVISWMFEPPSVNFVKYSPGVVIYGGGRYVYADDNNYRFLSTSLAHRIGREIEQFVFSGV